jgi:hypothetical protein
MGLSGLSAEETAGNGVLLARYSREEIKRNLNTHTSHKIEA